jgi:hypothetical protein
LTTGKILLTQATHPDELMCLLIRRLTFATHTIILAMNGATSQWLSAVIISILVFLLGAYLFKIRAHRYILVSVCAFSISIASILLGAYLFKIRAHGYIWPSFFEAPLDPAFDLLDEKYCDGQKERLTTIVEDDSISFSNIKSEKANVSFDITNVSTEECYRSPSEFVFSGIPDDFFNGKFFVAGFADLNNDNHDDILLYRQARFVGKNQEVFLFFYDNGRYTKDERFHSLDLPCRHEQMVLADFTNDGHTDIYITCYTHYEALEQRQHREEWQTDTRPAQNYLLINNGDGGFDEKADEFGVALRLNPDHIRVEGAQAFDINDDGWLDIYTGSRLYINHEGKYFKDNREYYGLPIIFDEGVNATDIDNDGSIDLVLFHPVKGGPLVYINEGQKFTHSYCHQTRMHYGRWYMTTADLNGDSWDDVIVQSPIKQLHNRLVVDETKPHIWLKGTPKGFVAVKNKSIVPMPEIFYKKGNKYRERHFSVFDLDRDGRFDVSYVTKGQNGDLYSHVLLNNSRNDNRTIMVEMVDTNGIRNQHGRKIIASTGASQQEQKVYVVDGGSGYLNQKPYAVYVSAPKGDKYMIEAHFRTGVVQTSAQPGERIRIYENGKIEKLNRACS